MQEDLKICNSRRVARLMSYVLLLISVVGFLVWNLNLDYQSDDLWYSHYFPGEDEYITNEPGDDFAFCVQPEITTWEQMWKSTCHHYIYWGNGRFAHTLKFASVMFPKWMTDVAHAIMILFMMWGLARLSSGRRWAEHPLRLGVITLFVWVGWPWFDMRGSSVFFFNYVWSAAMVLYFVILFQQLNKESSWGRIAWASVVGFIAAMMHEGISVPFMAGLGGYIVLGWFYGGKLAGVERPSKGHVISACCFLTGILCITVFCPSFMSRVGEHEIVNFWLPFVLTQFICRLYYFFFGIGLLFWLAYRKGWLWLKSVVVRNSVLIFASLLGYVMAIYGRMDMVRATWALCMACTVLDIKGIALIGLFKNRSRLSIALSAVCLILTICFFVELCLLQYKRTEQGRFLAKEIEKSPERNVYYMESDDNLDDYWWINRIAINWWNDINRAHLMAHINPGNLHSYGVLPSKYKGVPLDSLPLVPGTAGLRGIYPTYFTKNMGIEPTKTGEAWSSFYVTFGFPEDVSPLIKYTPASIARFIWVPHFDYNKVKSYYHLTHYRMAVTQELRDENFVGEDVDSIIVYTLYVGNATMIGMRPERIDCKWPGAAKK